MIAEANKAPEPSANGHAHEATNPDPTPIVTEGAVSEREMLVTTLEPSDKPTEAVATEAVANEPEQPVAEPKPDDGVEWMDKDGIDTPPDLTAPDTTKED